MKQLISCNSSESQLLIKFLQENFGLPEHVRAVNISLELDGLVEITCTYNPVRKEGQ